jgi:hypothetical protein
MNYNNVVLLVIVSTEFPANKFESVTHNYVVSDTVTELIHSS